MTLHLHRLKGCAPAPLASYLKALGILRLIGEQIDGQARGWWDGETFCLLTKLSKDELGTYFLETYSPTPLLSPWNKGCGFFKTDDPGLSPIENSQASRFEPFRKGVKEARKLIDAVGQADAVIRAIKARTKTNSTFQSEDQRQILDACKTYRDILDQLRVQREKPDLPPEKVQEIDRDIATIESLVTSVTKPPTRVEAEAIKASAGYKRLLASAERNFKSLKASLIPDCRRLWRGGHADWLSAAVVLNEQGNPEWPSLLGTGGNDGNLDFTNNFMQQHGALFELDSENGVPAVIAAELLANSLWGDSANKLSSAAVGQYLPGSAGGANSSTGFASGNLVNPWDFVLMMEGSLLFSSRATRRLDPDAFSRASAPFAVRPHAAGFATPGSEKAQRGEQWMPLWNQPSTLSEVKTLFGEARVQLSRQPANRPVDVARAISQLGVARGIVAFVRYGYLERNGQSTLAVPLGRVAVPKKPRPHAYLIDDLVPWMERIQRRCRDKNAPARLGHAELRLADAVFAALTHDHSPDRWQTILIAAAEIESLQATGTAIDAQPIPSLRPEWVRALDDGSVELRLALALGSAAADYQRVRPIDPVRHHWLPLEPGARRFRTSDKRLVNDPRVVVSGRDPIRDLSAVIERRLIEAAMNGQRRSLLIAAPGCGAQLGDLEAFLRGAVDLDKLLGLARAFMAIRWDQWSRHDAPQTAIPTEMPDDSWLAVRLACLAWPLSDDKDIPADPRLVRLLLAGDSVRAIEVARTRLRSVVIRPPLRAGVTDPETARRWAAALAFPIDHRTAQRMAERLDPRLNPRKGLHNV